MQGKVCVQGVQEDLFEEHELRFTMYDGSMAVILF